MDYLLQAFKELDLLTEEKFDLSDDGIEDMKKFDDDDEKDETVNIIDPDAEDEDELQNSYLGKVILDCNVCHSLIYKDVEELDINEETGIANEKEECPYCYTNDGFKIIGKVVPFNAADLEISYDEEDEDGKVKHKKLSITNDEDSDEEEFDDEDIDEQEQSEDSEEDEEDEEYSKKDKKKKSTKNECVKIRGRHRINESMSRRLNHVNSIRRNSRRFNEEFENVELDRHLDRSYYDDDYSDLNDDFDDDLRYKYNDLVVESRKYVGKKFNELEECGKSKVKFEDNIIEKLEEGFNNVDIKTDDTQLSMEQDPDSKEITIKSKPIDKSGFDFEESGDGETIAPLTDEDEEDILADEESEEENESEGDNESEDESELEDELEEMDEEEDEDEDKESKDEEDEDKEVEKDVEDFDEESFDKLGESYLKKVYSNVNSFNTNRVLRRGNKLVVEGLIGFNSGRSKKTEFVFEADSITRTNNVSFLGENKLIAKNRGSYALIGRLNRGRLVSESLDYNYKQGNNTVRGSVNSKRGK